MDALRRCCRAMIAGLERDRALAPVWNAKDAADMLWSMHSITLWEILTIDCGWSMDQYIRWVQQALKRIFLWSPR
jgi:hypothetical protein